MQSQIPQENSWLTSTEQNKCERFRIPKRRNDWLLGRCAAKNVAIRNLDLPNSALNHLEIIPASDGAPELFLNGNPVPFTISISHRQDHAIAAIADSAQKMGCDLEYIEPRSERFIADYFTKKEISFVSEHPEKLAERANLIWSAKEAAVKALRQGLRLDTRDVEIARLETQNTTYKFQIIHHSAKKNLWGTALIFNNYIAAFASESEKFELIQLG